MKIRFTVLVAAGLALAGTASAQGHRHGEQEREHDMRGAMQHGMPGMGHHMMPGMSRVGAFGPEHVLAKKDVLGLTAEQVARLTELKEQLKKAHDEAAASHDAHHKQLMEVLAKPRPALQEVQGHFRAAHEAMGNAHWAMMQASIQAMAVLTEVQRARVDGWADAMRERPRPMMMQRRERMERGRMPRPEPRR